MSSIELQYRIEKNEMDNIMQFILTNFCNSSVLGYNKHSDNFWCKKYDENIRCILHIEIHTKKKDIGQSEICVKPLIYNLTELQEFMSDFIDSIQIYKSSKFIRNLSRHK